MRYLLVQGHGGAHPQKARSDAVGHGHVVVVFAWVQKEEGQIVEQRIHTTEAERDVVSEETSEWCVDELCAEDENVPLERRPREQKKARGEEIQIHKIVEDAVTNVGRPDNACPVVSQTHGYIGERLKSVDQKQEDDDMVVKSFVERSISENMEQNESETRNGDDGDGEQDAELDRTRRVERSHKIGRAHV